MKKTRLSNIFPNTKVAAYYDQSHQLICLNSYNFIDFKGEGFKGIDKKSVDKLSLFEHELTHWIDHHSTLWGQQNIILLFNALNSRANQDINEFWRIKHLENSFRKDTFFDYFTEKHNHIQGNGMNRWKYQITSGVRFSSEGKPEHGKPILFVRFNSIDDIPIVRVPVSVASILETNAIKSEYFIKFLALKEDTDFINKKVSEGLLKEELMHLLYNPDLTLYSVIAHLTANLDNQQDIIETLDITSQIGTLVLNMPDDLMKNIKTPEIDNKIWEERYNSFIIEKDKGAIFYFLLRNLIDKYGQNKFSKEAILIASDLPNEEELRENIILEMEGNIKKLIDGPFKKMAVVAIKNGIEMFKKRGIFGDGKELRDYIIDNKIMPTILFGDTELNLDNLDVNDILKKLNNGDEISINEKYFIIDYYKDKFDEFLEVCGV